MSDPAAPPAAADPRPQSDRSIWTGPASVAIAWLMWLVIAIGISILVARNPVARTVTGEYRDAALSFLHSRPMYKPGAMGWLYPVQSAMVFIPFTFEPRAAVDVFWRLVGIGGLALALWRLSLFCSPPMRGDKPATSNPHSSGTGPPYHNLFLLLTLFVTPAALGAIRNGQVNVHLTAMFIFACIAIMRQKWGTAAIWLCIALAAKPTSIVLLLLFTAIHRPLWWRIPVGLAIVAAAPFLHPNWSYIISQYSAGLQKVLEAGNLHDFGAFHPADLTSLLALARIELPDATLTAIRALAALATLAICWLATRHYDRRTGAVLVLGLGAAYLMVFNPRTEGNTYVIFAPALAMLTCWSLAERRSSPRSIILTTAAVLMGFCQFLVLHEREYWIRPGETLLLLVALGAAIVAPSWRAKVPRAPALE